MGMNDFVVLAVIIAWIAAAVCYIHKKRKSGRCIGCSGGVCDMCKRKKQK